MGELALVVTNDGFSEYMDLIIILYFRSGGFIEGAGFLKEGELEYLRKYFFSSSLTIFRWISDISGLF